MTLTPSSSAVVSFPTGTPVKSEPRAWDPKWTPAARQALLKNGYEPIPLNGKRPVLDAWQNSHATLNDISAWETAFPGAGNTGVLTRFVPAVDDDVLDPEVADLIHGWVRELIPPGCPELLRFGKRPKRAILFRCDVPFPKISTGKWLDNNNVEHQLEILCDGQQVAVYGPHPDTHEPYNWPGPTPGRTPRTSLPLLTPEAAQSLVNRAKALFQERGWRPKREERPKEPPRANGFERSDSFAHKIALGLADRIEALCRELLPKGRIEGKDWAVGGINGEAGQSLKICLVGEHRGLWLDHADEGWRGDALDLVEAVKNLKTIDAMDWARSWLGWPKWEPSREKTKQTDSVASDSPNTQRDWSDPDWSILDDRRGELPEFPIDALSEPIRVWVKRAALGAGVTVAHVAVPAIGIASSLIGTARRIQATRSWLQCATCWTAVVGFSGTGKTPGIDTIKRALTQIERDRKKSIAELRRKHETKAAQAKAARKRWQKQADEAIEANLPAPEMPLDAEEPGKFIVPRLHISDGTIERFGELLTARPQGVLRLTDELSAMFMNMSRYSGGQDNEFWLESWNGGAYNVERIGRNLQIDNLLIGIVGGLQPDKLAQAFKGAADGMYARILFGWPPEPAFYSLSDEADEIDPAIYNALVRLDKLAEFEDGKLVIRDIPLSPEAREGFERFRRFVHDQKDALEGREREWWAKATAHVLRLAITLSLFDWAMGAHKGGQDLEPTTVAETYTDSAIRLVRDYFWPHARAALRQIGLSDRHLNSRRVLRWVKANSKDEISLRDARRLALSELLNEELTKQLLDGLERAGWLRKTTRPPGPAGGKPIIRWLVNPVLYGVAQTAETAET
jgi:Protein of unknown function (DUF3987)/Bifunctional DNA primase/polymerase, N-terminal